MKEYIESINVNIIADTGIFKWCWYKGEYWVCQSYEKEFTDGLKTYMEKCK